MSQKAKNNDIPRVRPHGTGSDPILSPEQREAEKLYLNGKKVKEIAIVLGCDPRKIYSWIKKFRWKERLVQIEKTPEYIQGILLLKLADEVEGLTNKKGISTVEADKIVKIVSSIKSLRKESDMLGNILLAQIEFTNFLSETAPKLLTKLQEHLGSFTNRMVKKYG